MWSQPLLKFFANLFLAESLLFKLLGSGYSSPVEFIHNITVQILHLLQMKKFLIYSKLRHRSFNVLDN